MISLKRCTSLLRLHLTLVLQNRNLKGFCEPVILCGRIKTVKSCNYSMSNESSTCAVEELGKKPPKKNVYDKAQVFKEIAQDDNDLMCKLKLIDFEISILKEKGNRVPQVLSKENWRQLLEFKTLNQRLSYLSFKHYNECKSESDELKKQYYKKRVLKKLESAGEFYYGLSGLSIFHRIYEKTINRVLYQRLFSAKQKIVFDCSYQSFMHNRNVRACAKQIQMCLNSVKLHPFPCMLEFCNFRKDDSLGKVLPFYNPGIYDNNVFSFHTESYMDLYPREKLVYLTPHSTDSLLEINQDNIYVIGAFVDKGIGGKTSLIKAKEDGIRCAKLPIDHYLVWKNGGKCFPLNIVLDIMLDILFYKDWCKAFKNIPPRCVYNALKMTRKIDFEEDKEDNFDKEFSDFHSKIY